MPLGQPTLIRRLQGIPTLDDSTIKGHYTNSNLIFKASIRVCNLRHTATMATYVVYSNLISNERPLAPIM